MRVVVGDGWKRPIRQQRLVGKARAEMQPFRIEFGEGDAVGKEHLCREFTAAFDDRLDELKTLHVDDVGPALGVDVEGQRNAAHQPVGVGVLAAENRMDLDDVFLKVESLNIVGHQHEVGLR